MLRPDRDGRPTLVGGLARSEPPLEWTRTQKRFDALMFVVCLALFAFAAWQVAP